MATATESKKQSTGNGNKDRDERAKAALKRAGLSQSLKDYSAAEIKRAAEAKPQQRGDNLRKLIMGEKASSTSSTSQPAADDPTKKLVEEVNAMKPEQKYPATPGQVKKVLAAAGTKSAEQLTGVKMATLKKIAGGSEAAKLPEKQQEQLTAFSTDTGAHKYPGVQNALVLTARVLVARGK